jgi:hypothetical protein
MSSKKAYGDFQTPLSLARRVVAFVCQSAPLVTTVVEPTCGVGAFLEAAAERFGKGANYWGFDVNPEYVEVARSALERGGLHFVAVEQRDFYDTDWRKFLSEQSGPLLILGNPPWITSAEMGAIGGKNLPEKSNFQGHGGFAAKTGKANFDISEWMMIKLLEALQGTQATVALLCKTATARKVLRYAWLNGLETGSSSLHLIDAGAEFGVSVEACLFYTQTGIAQGESTATIYPSLSFDSPLQTFGLLGGELVSDIDAYRELRNLEGIAYRKWRSGVKHDAAKIMEFTLENGIFVNGLGERCDLESEYLFPLLKSSDLANGRLKPTRFVLLTQRKVSDPTIDISRVAPKTWRYLLDHADQLDQRGSSIYENRARFSVFGVGEYSFAPAKVAISGLYKNLHFRAVGKSADKPIMVDDTCNFIPCDSMAEAQFFADLLNTTTAQRFISALVFMDAKRPVTIDILKRIDLKKLAEFENQEPLASRYLSPTPAESERQALLAFEPREEYRVKKSASPRKLRGTALAVR